MKVEYKKIVTSDELAHLVPTKAGATFSQLWQIFYFTRLFKYIRYDHFQMIKPAFKKIATYKNLQKLCSMGYLFSPKPEVYCATDKVLPILREAGYSTAILPQTPKGTGDINELNNTDVFVRLVTMKHFHALLYPHFNYLIPDALFVQKHEIKRMYKLTFLEIEAQKPNWKSYIENKRSNYIRLSKDLSFFKYWKSICPHLSLPEPDVQTIGFSVRFFGTLKNDFGKGFAFSNPLYHERS